MSKLNPCPFCGGQAIMKIQKHIPNGYDYTPTCQDPSCAGRLTKKWVNEADAIEAWNKRMRADRCCNTCDSYEAGRYCLSWGIFCPSDHWCKDWSENEDI